MIVPHKPRQAEEVVELVRPLRPEWFIDCGIGWGCEAQVFRKAFPRINILGLEPSPARYDEIKEDYPGILLNKAVWSSSGSMPLYHVGSEQQSSLVVLPGWAAHSEDVVECVSLDDLWREYGFRRAVLWIDVEHAEDEAIAGGQECLQNAVIAINSEVYQDDNPDRHLPEWAKMNWESRIDSLLAPFGFHCIMSYCKEGVHHDNVYLKRPSKPIYWQSKPASYRMLKPFFKNRVTLERKLKRK